MTAKQPALNIDVGNLRIEEREQLNALIRKGKAPARQVLKARILVKADASKAGYPGIEAAPQEAWSRGDWRDRCMSALQEVVPWSRMVDGGAERRLAANGRFE